jgi:hypothetical protein
MRETALPSPNIGSRGYHLRRVATQVISQLEVAATFYPDGKHPAAATLADFFTAAKAAVDAIKPA